MIYSPICPVLVSVNPPVLCTSKKMRSYDLLCKEHYRLLPDKLQVQLREAEAAADHYMVAAERQHKEAVFAITLHYTEKAYGEEP